MKNVLKTTSMWFDEYFYLFSKELVPDTFCDLIIMKHKYFVINTSFHEAEILQRKKIKIQKAFLSHHKRRIIAGK